RVDQALAVELERGPKLISRGDRDARAVVEARSPRRAVWQVLAAGYLEPEVRRTGDTIPHGERDPRDPGRAVLPEEAVAVAGGKHETAVERESDRCGPAGGERDRALARAIP